MVADPVRCQVWLADLACYREELTTLLDQVERDRLTRYQMASDRQRSTVAAALLRQVAGRRLGVPAGQLRIDRSCPECDQPHGKPTVRDAADLQVSVSHSAELVAVAVTEAAPIGVDVEFMVERDYPGLARSFLAAGERVDDADSFYRLWTRKEALVKATGDGLRMPLPNVIAGGSDHVVSYAGAALSCCIADLQPRAGYIGAVAVLTAGTLEVDVRSAEEVLAIDLG
jgi:4'-phosphopantetheinyl transferase